MEEGGYRPKDDDDAGGVGFLPEWIRDLAKTNPDLDARIRFVAAGRPCFPGPGEICVACIDDRPPRGYAADPLVTAAGAAQAVLRAFGATDGDAIASARTPEVERALAKYRDAAPGACWTDRR